MSDIRLEGKFEGKGTVCIRCGGRGAEFVGQEVHIKTKGSGEWKTVRLLSLVQDYGSHDVCVYTFSWK